MTPAYLLFHLNLAFSSVDSERRPEIVKRCYTPMLDLVEKEGLPIGVELSGWTLTQIASIDSSWVRRFRNLLDDRRCELIGSGWVQLIGPLVPTEVNHWNQKLGVAAYQSLLDRRPRIALVNEMAYSASMVDHYAEAGYSSIVMDRDNVRLALGLESQPLAAMPTHAAGPCGAVLPVLWGDSNLFQYLQRVVHGDKSLQDYLAYVGKRLRADNAVLPIYCNDAEVFDFRPGRFRTEAALAQSGEWTRLAEVISAVRALDVEVVLPSDAIQAALDQSAGQHRSSPLNSVSYPVPVKKQAKYNVNRWAITGRDDLALNTACHALSAHLLSIDCKDPLRWQQLCEFWASDLRTHITAKRWEELQANLRATAQRMGDGAVSRCADYGTTILEPAPSLPENCTSLINAEQQSLTIATPHVRLVLSLRRGLAIESLAFSSRSFEPVVGTLAQGYFDSIALGADFYSGGVIMEVPGDRIRHTDLERVSPRVVGSSDAVVVCVDIPFAGGTLTKTYRVAALQPAVDCCYRFTGIQRPLGSLRAGILTFLNDRLNLPLTVKSHQGGSALETFVLDRQAEHAVPASALVSSSAALSATGGVIHLEDASGGHLLGVRWNPANCAAMPMLTHVQATPHPFTRLKFSLCELDDTSKPGGNLEDFSIRLEGSLGTRFKTLT